MVTITLTEEELIRTKVALDHYDLRLINERKLDWQFESEKTAELRNKYQKALDSSKKWSF